MKTSSPKPGPRVAHLFQRHSGKCVLPSLALTECLLHAGLRLSGVQTRPRPPSALHTVPDTL